MRIQCKVNPFRAIGSPVRWPTRIDLRTDLIWPRRRRVSTGLHATNTGMHTSIFSHTQITGRTSRQYGLCLSRERSLTIWGGHTRSYRSFPEVSKWLSSGKGYDWLFCLYSRTVSFTAIVNRWVPAAIYSLVIPRSRQQRWVGPSRWAV